ncbi:hypothetical protein ACFZAG_42030, partial [Streptomyces sp. NPDC012403]
MSCSENHARPPPVPAPSLPGNGVESSTSPPVNAANTGPSADDGTWAGGGTSDDTTGTAGAAGAAGAAGSLDDGVDAGEAPTDGPSDEGAWTVGASDEDTS